MPEAKRRQFLREKEATQLLLELSQKLKINTKELLEQKKTTVEQAGDPNIKIYYLNGKPAAVKLKDRLLPTLQFEKALQHLPKIVVNMGAVPHICNGADVLAPGIVKIAGAFAINDYVVVVDERHQKPLAVAAALVDSQAANSLKHGKVAENLHYVGDAVWNRLKQG